MFVDGWEEEVDSQGGVGAPLDCSLTQKGHLRIIISVLGACIICIAADSPNVKVPF